MGSKKKTKETQQSLDAADSNNAAAAGGKAEGPVLAAVSRRLRAVRKKLNRVEELEDGLANGKQPHPDQEGLLKSKPGLLNSIDELEKLIGAIKDAVKEELDIQKEELQADHQAELDAVKSNLAETATALEEAQAAAAAALAEVEEVKAAAAQPPPEPEPEPAPVVDVEHEKLEAVSAGVMRLLQLLYFSQMFDEAGPWSTASERKACVTYDYAVQLEGEPLSDADLIMVSRFGKSLITRPAGKLIDHKSMVQRNAELAVKFLQREPEVLPELGCSVERVDERLERVLASDYYTILPKVVLHQMPYEEEQAAPAGSAPPPPNGPPPAAAPPQPEGSVPFPADSHARSIQQLPPMPNISASAAAGSAILDDPAIAMSQLSRTGASIPPPPAVAAPKQMAPPAVPQGPPGAHPGQQIHRSQMPPVLQQLLGQQPPAYPNYMPQQPMPMPGFGVAPPTQFGLQDPTVYSFGSLSGIDLNTSAPMDAPLPSSLPPPQAPSSLPPTESKPSHNLPHPSANHTPPPMPTYSMPPAIPEMPHGPPHAMPPNHMLSNGGMSPQIPPPAPGVSHNESPQAPPPSMPPSNSYGPPPHHFAPRGDRGFERGRGGRGRGGGGGGRGVTAAPPGDVQGRGNRGVDRGVDREGEQRGEQRGPRGGGEGRGGFRGGRGAGGGGRDGRRGRGQGPPVPQGMPTPQVMYQPPPPGPPMMIPPQAQYNMQ